MSASLRVEIDLSVAILPKFVAAARVQGSLWAARPKLRAFYRKVVADLVVINEILSGLREHHDSVLGQFASGGLSLTVKKLLRRLERLARTRGDLSAAHFFPKLQTLRHVSATTSNDICGLRQISRTVMKEERVKFLRILDNCCKTLTGIVIQQTQLFTATSMQQGDQPSRDLVADPESNQATEEQAPDLVREVQILHNAIATRWLCSCWRRHGALLRLTSFYVESDANVHPAFHMDLLFSHNSVDSWKRAQIKLERRPARVQFDAEIVIAAANEVDDANIQDIPVQPIGRLCQLTFQCEQNRHLIYLLAKEHQTNVRLRGTLKGLANRSVERLIPLSMVLAGPGENAFLDLRQNVMERLMLANILAKAVLHLCASPWVRRQWVKERLCLALSDLEVSSTDSVLQLHLISDLDEPAERDDYDDVQHPCPVLVDLGILLIELEFGKPIQEIARLMWPGEQAAGVELHRSPSISLLDRVLQSDFLSRTFIPYRKAIWACYNCKVTGSNTSEMQQWIKCNISDPLNQLLSASYEIRITPEGIRNSHGQSAIPGDIFERNTPPLENSPCVVGDLFISKSFQRGKFLDCERGLMPADESKWTGADDWFEILRDKTFSHLNRLGVTGRPDKPIKIAILDTGIDARLHPRTRDIMATNSQLSGSSNRIKGLRSWVNHKDCGENVKSMKDEHGHGTHAAALILKVTPFAHLYVAQITNGVSFEPDPVAVWQAIKYAAEDWKVDIISMSFGFDDKIGNIPEAITAANANGVIMVAAASNGGKIKSEGDSYPAVSVEVISIRSANGNGRASEFNPDRPEQGVYLTYFNVVGEYVLSAWPEHLDVSGEKRDSGTSISTPIAAGVVALLLDYVWARLPASMDKAAKTALYDSIRRTPNATGMRLALRFMTSRDEAQGGLSFIKPWLLMSDEATARWGLFRECFHIP